MKSTAMRKTNLLNLTRSNEVLINNRITWEQKTSPLSSTQVQCDQQTIENAPRCSVLRGT